MLAYRCASKQSRKHELYHWPPSGGSTETICPLKTSSRLWTIGSDAADLPIIQAVISLAHGLGIDVVAEGIETPAQLACLRDLSCDRGQGFAFARPLPPDDLEAMLARSGDAPLILDVAPAA